MHHQGGAWQETRFIYAPVVRQNFQQSRQAIRFVSVGLGLGYNEILIAQVAAELGNLEFEIYSYESEAWLRDCFQAWVTDQGHSVLAPLYTQIVHQAGACETQIRQILGQALQQNRWKICPALTSPLDLPSDVTGYLWDAFSKKTSPELWDEEFLKLCFAKAHPEFSVLGTYASLGALKRSLKFSGFEILKTQGFRSKRGSTHAQRIRL